MFSHLRLVYRFKIPGRTFFIVSLEHPTKTQLSDENLSVFLDKIIPPMDSDHPQLGGGLKLPLWKMMELVGWDDEIPNMMGKKTCSSHHQPASILLAIVILQLIIKQKGFCSHCSSAELHMRRCQNTSFSASHGIYGPDSGLFAWLSMDWFKGKSTGNHGFYYKI